VRCGGNCTSEEDFPELTARRQRHKGSAPSSPPDTRSRLVLPRTPRKGRAQRRGSAACRGAPKGLLVSCLSSRARTLLLQTAVPRSSAPRCNSAYTVAEAKAEELAHVACGAHPAVTRRLACRYGGS